jgi:peptidyl-dipeptidase Dcp
MATADGNPLLASSELPHGLPPFGQISTEHYLPALLAGMARQLAEVEAIVANVAPPSFENTLVALELSGQLLARVRAVFDNAQAADTSPAIRAVAKQVEPLLAAHADDVWLNARLYARVNALYERRDQLDLDAADARLLERYYVKLVRAGARLPASRQKLVRELNRQLAALGVEFRERVLAERNDLAVWVEDRAELAGLSEDAISAAAAAARTAGHDHGYLIQLVLPTSQPQLALLENRPLRQRIHAASVNRGTRHNSNDTRALVLEIAAKRAKRARLLGYASHAEYVIADNSAGSIETVRTMLDALTAAATRQLAADAADLQECILESGETFTLEPWDWAYYAERRRRERYALDETALRPYFELERTLQDGVFFAANRLYGLSFVERPDLRAYHPEARVFEVFDEGGHAIGLYIADFYTRASKQGGAWSQALVQQSSLLGTSVVVVNNFNLTKPAAGEPALLTTKEVKTLFHEFGHALHELLARVRYPMFAGTNVPQDYVEFPSQINEMWALWPEVLANYAKHHLTGEPLPAQLVDRLLASSAFNQGFETTAQVAAAVLDLAWHMLGDGAAIDDVEGFELSALTQAGVAIPVVPPRYRSAYFAHIFFASYSGVYSAYDRSDLLTAEVAGWFASNGGLRRENGDAFLALLAPGGSVVAMDAYRSFLGREPRIDALLTRRGLAALRLDGRGAACHLITPPRRRNCPRPPSESLRKGLFFRYCLIAQSWPLRVSRDRSDLVGDTEPPAPVDHDLLARHVFGRGRREEQSKRLDVVRLADAVHRDLAGKCRLHAGVASVAAADVRGEEPRRDRVCGDTVGGELERDRPHELTDAGLRGHVRGADHGLDSRRRERRGHDDSSEAARPHVADCCTNRREHAVEIDVDHPVPAVVPVALERPVRYTRTLPANPTADEARPWIDPRIRERDVQPSVDVGCTVDRRLQRGAIGHVRRDTADVEAVALQAGRLGRNPIAIDVDQRDARAVGRQHLSVGEADTAGTAGDDHTKAGHVKSREDVHALLLISMAGQPSKRDRPAIALICDNVSAFENDHVTGAKAMTDQHAAKPAGSGKRRSRALLILGASILVETVGLWLRTGRPGGNVVVRCRQGHLFTTLWIPAASLKSVRLGWWRLQRCPVGRHWTIVAPVREAALTDEQRRLARERHDLRIP